MPHALVIDDEADLCRLMQMTLTKMGITSDVAYELEHAKTNLANKAYDFCLTDLKLPDGSGLDIVKLIAKEYPLTPVAVITAHGNMDLAIEALKLGAFDFVNKPLELPRLKQLVYHALKVGQEFKAQPTDTLKSTPSPSQQLLDKHLIGTSDAMTQLKSTIIKLARSQAPVFLWGASGTGKEVVARMIHQLSPRQEGAFVPVNCGAIPSELMESEFFGHKKGSFTGATSDKMGLFQQASGGTLFLDEVADLHLSMQVKLLRAIQEKTIRAIGDTKEVPVDIRILSATHKNLYELVEKGQFRQDLFYRINVIELKLPTLNQRRSDVPMLAGHFLRLIEQEWQLEEPLHLTDTAIDFLQHYDFVGNVRELRNLLERAITMTDSTDIDVTHLQPTHLSRNAPTQHQQTQQDTHRANQLNNQMANSPTINNEPRPNQTSTLLPPQPNISMNANALTPRYGNANVNMPSSITVSTAPNTPPNVTNNTNNTQNQHQTDAYLFPISHSPTSQHDDKHNTGQNNITGQNNLEQKNDKNTHQEEMNRLSANNKVGANLTIWQSFLDEHLKPNNLPKYGIEAFLQEQERILIAEALKLSEGNKTEAARLLNLTMRSLRYRMDKLEIDYEANDADM